VVTQLKKSILRDLTKIGRGVAQPGQRTCFGSRGSEVQILSPRPLKPLLAMIMVLLLASVALAQDSCWYVVRPGDFLGRIATATGTSIKAIKSSNNLRSDTIHPGQKLKIGRPFRGSKSKSVTWGKPFSGRHDGILRPYGTHKNGRVTLPRTGTDVLLAANSRLLSPADGILRYAGLQEGYGYLMIIEHASNYATVLGPFDPESVQVQTDFFIRRGQALGRLGEPIEGNRPYAHIELRRNNNATNPARLLK
jgi:murein DD-endopeptidase MepM/ murein hydrolase activator NlpD